jgi:hypothetical protein
MWDIQHFYFQFVPFHAEFGKLSTPALLAWSNPSKLEGLVSYSFVTLAFHPWFQS